MKCGKYVRIRTTRQDQIWIAENSPPFQGCSPQNNIRHLHIGRKGGRGVTQMTQLMRSPSTLLDCLSTIPAVSPCFQQQWCDHGRRQHATPPNLQPPASPRVKILPKHAAAACGGSGFKRILNPRLSISPKGGLRDNTPTMGLYRVECYAYGGSVCVDGLLICCLFGKCPERVLEPAPS